MRIQKTKSIEDVDMKYLLCGKAPFIYAESYKRLRTNLGFALRNHDTKKLVITSSISNECKSTVALNLAISLAKSGSSVLLIDCDFRRPTLQRVIRTTPEEEGLVPYLLGEEDSLESSIIKTRFGFSFLGASTMNKNPTELLASRRMKLLLDSLAEEYEYVICDAPPAGVTSDAAVLSQYCDGAVFIIRQGYATKRQVQQAKENLDAVGAKVLGVVMTQYDTSKDLQLSRSLSYGKYREEL